MNSRVRRGFAVVLAVLVGAAAMPPQSAWAEHGHGARLHRMKRHAGPPPASYCPRLCVADVTPCDPMEYKIADGRCGDPFFLY